MTWPELTELLRRRQTGGTDERRLPPPEPVASPPVEAIPGATIAALPLPHDALVCGTGVSLAFVRRAVAGGSMNPRRWAAAWPSTKIENRFKEACIKRPSEHDQEPPGPQVPSSACRREGPDLRSAP